LRTTTLVNYCLKVNKPLNKRVFLLGAHKKARNARQYWLEFSRQKKDQPTGGAFRVKPNDTKILNERKEHLAIRLDRKQFPEQKKPLMKAQTFHYEMADRIRAIDCGGISGLSEAINEKLHLLKRHLPYHESDHVLNIAYNTLTGGTCLDDIELRRNDETFMDGLGVERIPDPTTAGDFTRRFGE
jgi:hypothetical protein